VPRSNGTPYRARIKIAGNWLDEMSHTVNVERLRIENDYIRTDEALLANWRPLADALTMLANTFYIGPFRNALNLTQANDSPYFDIAIGQNLISQWQNMQSGLSNKLSELAHNVTTDISNIFRFNELQFISSPDHQTVQVMANGHSYKLTELGSGLAQFFLVFANIAGQERRPSYILIDEPELNLHPSLQLDFLVSLASYATHGIVFATHSVGLARTIAHPIYSVYRDEAGVSTIQSLEDPTNWAHNARELSFSGHSELGFDTILLAEGKNDIPTLQQFLRLYGKDHRVMLWPMHGRELINPDAGLQLHEMKRISDRVFALIDSERSATNEPLQPRIQGFVEACRDARVECKVLDFRALENYLSERAIKHVMGDKRRALLPYEKLGNVSPSWPKTDDWRIAREMTRAELDGTDLGEFLGRL
jgi:predicted ATPase